MAAYDFLDGLEQRGVRPEQGAVDRVTAESTESRDRTPCGYFRNMQTVIEAAFR